MWQETITLTMDYNYRAATWTCLWLPVFVVNIIVLSSMSLFIIICKYKKAIAAKFDRLATSQNEERDHNIGDPEPNERTPLLQSNSSPQNTESNDGPNNY